MEGHGRSNKIAIVRFKFKEEASRAVEEREVNIEFSVASIERAIQRPKIDRGDRDRDRGTFDGKPRVDFSDLKRSNRN
jgi:hypothetical protein